MFDINGCVVLATDGTISVKATLKNVGDAITHFNTSFANDLDVVGAAVESVFDQYKGTTITTPTLASLAVARLHDIQPTDWAKMEERVKAYVGAQVAGGLFTVTKGRNGGVTRLADVVAE
jgi:hypothetical protein